MTLTERTERVERTGKCDQGIDEHTPVRETPFTRVTHTTMTLFLCQCGDKGVWSVDSLR